MRIYLILDSNGNIAGTLRADVRQSSELPLTAEEEEGTIHPPLRPPPPALPEQTVYEVELPNELVELFEDSQRATELHEALQRYQIKAETTELVLREGN